MNHESYAGSYFAAMQAATHELDGMFEEAGRLRARMEQINSAINALKPLFASGAEGQPAPEILSLDALSQEWNAATNPAKPQIDPAINLVLA